MQKEIFFDGITMLFVSILNTSGNYRILVVVAYFPTASGYRKLIFYRENITQTFSGPRRCQKTAPDVFAMQPAPVPLTPEKSEILMVVAGLPIQLEHQIGAGPGLKRDILVAID